MDKARRYHHLDALRGLSIFLIVGGHARGYSDPGRLGLPFSIDAFFDATATMSVPAFFLVDGYLFARSSGRPGPFDYFAYLRRSALRLLVPWVVFTVLYTGARAAFEAVGFFPERLVIGRPAAEVARAIYESQIAMQMYFLLSLFLIRSISFATRSLARAPGWVLIPTLIGFTGLLLGCGFRLMGDPITNAISGFRYYLIGMIVWKYDAVLRAHGPRLWPILILAVVGLDLAHPNVGPATQYLTLLAAYVFFLATTRGEDLLVALGRQTMGIYLLHAPVVLKGAQRIAERLTQDRLGRFLAIWALSFLMALALSRVILRIPRGRILFGEFAVGPAPESGPGAAGSPPGVGGQRNSR